MKWDLITYTGAALLALGAGMILPAAGVLVAGAAVLAFGLIGAHDAAAAKKAVKS